MNPGLTYECTERCLANEGVAIGPWRVCVGYELIVYSMVYHIPSTYLSSSSNDLFFIENYDIHSKAVNSTLDIDTLFLTDIILNFSSFHNFSLTAA